MRIFGFACLLILMSGFAAGEETPYSDESGIGLRAAIEKSLPYLAEVGRAWMDGKVKMQDGGRCVSCHRVNFGIWSHNAASLAGLTIDKAKHDQLNADATSFLSDPEQRGLVTCSHLLLANSPVAEQQRQQFVEFATAIIERQESEGYWQAKGQFPTQDRPIMESNAVATMWALAATKPFASDPDIKAGRDRALKWLAGSKTGSSTEWHAWRLIVEHLEQKDDVASLQESLIKTRQADGGWSWLENNPSDAYATGQVIYALVTTGLPVESDVVQKAVDFLVTTQRDDGTWPVPSGQISAEPDENKDQIYSYWGTAWAVIALSRCDQTRLAGS